jgi:hypothetical protein
MVDEVEVRLAGLERLVIALMADMDPIKLQAVRLRIERTMAAYVGDDAHLEEGLYRLQAVQHIDEAQELAIERAEAAPPSPQVGRMDRVDLESAVAELLDELGIKDPSSDDLIRLAADMERDKTRFSGGEALATEIAAELRRQSWARGNR